MTILTATSCFDGYPLRAVNPDLSSRLLTSIPERHAGNVRLALLRLECFLQITGQTLSTEDLQGNSRSLALEHFMGACYANALGTGSIPVRTCYFLKVALKSSFPALVLPDHTTKAAIGNVQLSSLRAEFLATPLDAERTKFWRGWQGQNAAGRSANLRLWRFYERYGSEATEQLSNAAFDWWKGKRNHSIPLIQELADHACVSGSVVNFQDSISLGNFLADFFRTWLSNRGAMNRHIPSSVVTWGRLVELLDTFLLGTTWAYPLPEVPRPRSRSQRGMNSRVSVNPEGFEVKESLLTPVPLEITDEQAFQLLFKDIQADHGTMRRWAEMEVELANARIATREMLATKGVAYRHRAQLTIQEERASGTYLKHACATFERDGLSHLGSPTETTARYPKPYAQTAWELGLPTPALLLAYGTVLVDEHPELTPALLSEFELFDRRGQKTGIQLIDGVWVLSGLKRRRGTSLAEQKIVLSEQALKVVIAVEKITEPLRGWLKHNGNNAWRRLFLSIASMGRKPKAWSPDREAHRQVAWISARLTELLKIEKDRADSLASRFSLRRVRSSRGVLIYIETCSLEAMAKSLGHQQFRQNLLDHYLPRPIQDFFTERWVRLFQTGIICEAMKDSRHLIEAAGFKSLETLNSFLEHHILKKIPVHIDGSTSPEFSEAVNQFVFGVSEQNLTLLRSIEMAVAEEPNSAAATAIRWARISEKLFPHLESQTEQPDLRQMANLATKLATSAAVKDLVRA